MDVQKNPLRGPLPNVQRDQSFQRIGFIIEYHLSHFLYYELEPQSQSTQLLPCC